MIVILKCVTSILVIFHEKELKKLLPSRVLIVFLDQTIRKKRYKLEQMYDYLAELISDSL